MDRPTTAIEIDAPHEPARGFRKFYNPLRNTIVFEVHYTADPLKRDPRWIAGVKRGKAHSAYRREYEMDWTAPGGNPYYPEFAEQHELFTQPLPALIKGPVLRGWDFGRVHPAVVFAQYSRRSHRLWVIREVMPAGIDIYSFRDLVRYLSGQLPLPALTGRPRAMAYLAELHRNRKHDEEWSKVPEPPWFSQHTRFLDYAGHEASQGSDRVEQTSIEHTRSQVLAQAGIHIQTHPIGRMSKIEVGTDLLRSLMIPWPDGFPGLLVDPACPLLLSGLKGGVAYPPPTKGVPIPSLPMKDGFYEHLHDALRYLAINVVPIAPDGSAVRPAHPLGPGVKQPQGVTEMPWAKSMGASAGRWGTGGAGASRTGQIAGRRQKARLRVGGRGGSSQRVRRRRR